ncbi:MAG: hypothetical protein U9M95_06365 [Candidatus Altiarchaeota archaeon]|nr:hypothetical protein [Candidatus Altiarchaeota archaeon]
MEHNNLINPALDTGLVLKKNRGGNLLAVAEMGGVFLIPALSILVLLWDTTVYSILLFILSVLVSYEIVKIINEHKRGVAVDDEIKMLAGGAVYLDTKTPATINWEDVDRVRIYQPEIDKKIPGKEDTTISMSILSYITDKRNPSFFHLITRDGRLYRGMLEDDKTLKGTEGERD